MRQTPQFQFPAYDAHAEPTRVGTRFIFRAYAVLGLMLLTAAASVESCTPYLPFLAAHPLGLTLSFFVAFFAALLLRNTPVLGFAAALAFAAVAGALVTPEMFAVLRSPGGAAAMETAALEVATLLVGLSAFGYLFRNAVSRWGEFLFAGLLVLLVALLASFFVPVSGMLLALSTAGVLIFSGLIVYDTARLAHTGNHESGTSIALGLFLDVVNLYQFVLGLNRG